MTLNRILTTLGAAGLGLIMATSAMAESQGQGQGQGQGNENGGGNSNADPYTPSEIIGSIGLGFGKFIGTWEVVGSDGTGNTGNPGGNGGNAGGNAGGDAIPSTMPNPNDTRASQVGDALQFIGVSFNDPFQYAGGTTGATTGTNHFPIDSTDPITDNKGFQVVDFLNDGVVAKWTYSGFPQATQAEIDNGESPGMALVDLFIAIKYNNYVSVFRYELVDPDDEVNYGYLSSDFRTIILNTALADGVDPQLLADDAGLELAAASYGGDGLDEPGLNYDGFYSGFSDGCVLSDNDDSTSAGTLFSRECMMYNTQGENNPYGISHVAAYWPPIDGEEVPEPASMTLLGAGLVGLGWLNRRRKAA